MNERAPRHGNRLTDRPDRRSGRARNLRAHDLTLVKLRGKGRRESRQSGARERKESGFEAEHGSFRCRRARWEGRRWMGERTLEPTKQV